MKHITIIAERVPEQSLAAVLPPAGVTSLSVRRDRPSDVDGTALESRRAFHHPTQFRPEVRVDVVVEDQAVESVFDALSFAYGAGFFSDAEAAEALRHSRRHPDALRRDEIRLRALVRRLIAEDDRGTRGVLRGQSNVER